MRRSSIICYLCHSKLGREELISELVVSKGKELIQLFDYKKEIISRLLPAYLNAMVRYQDRSLRSRDIGKEMLLMVAGTMNIASAIERCGVKDPNRFLLFSNSKRLYGFRTKETRIKVVKEYRLKCDEKIASDVAMTSLANG